MERAMAQAGFTPITVADGDAALASAVARPPAIIFLDVVMPLKTGLETCRAIRAALGRRCPPIIVVTGEEADDAILEGLESGATDYLIKPVNWTLLRHRVRGWLAAHQAGQDALRAAPRGQGRTLRVARDGTVLADSEAAATGAEGPDLAAVLKPPFAGQVMVCVRKVLKTREPTALSYAQWDVQISAEGRDRAQVVIRKAAVAEAGELFRLAYLDAATGLPNRHLFERTAEGALSEARIRGRGLLLLCVTFDPLPALWSDHAQRRQVTRALADQMVMRLRDSDYLVRYGSFDDSDIPVASADDMHFFVLLADAGARGALQAVSSRIKDACLAAAERIGTQASLAPRIGVARFPEDADVLPALIERAVLAAGEARQLGDTEPRRARAPAASAGLQADLAGELRHALAAGQIQLHYQPRIDLRTRDVVGAEALLRWQHPLRGLLTAGTLLPMAETAGEAVRLTDWALEQACRQASTWARELPSPLRVAVNTSQNQLARPDFAQRIIDRVAALGLDPALIEIEIDENCLELSEALLAQLLRLRHAGIGLIVDDFGAGRSSLGTLRRLRINGFKMDHAGLRTGSQAGEVSGIYALTASIARTREACVIAKGIETAEELAIARARGCDQAQGFHLCQPLPVEQFELYLARARDAASASAATPRSQQPS
jgi:EAL domain-containing protein (putative c-di-GMP-specific phosphodiesterase class I)/CheY-like chemotaxis protein/GGDEF domain-containing protein